MESDNIGSCVDFEYFFFVILIDGVMYFVVVFGIFIFGCYSSYDSFNGLFFGYIYKDVVVYKVRWIVVYIEYMNSDEYDVRLIRIFMVFGVDV